MWRALREAIPWLLSTHISNFLTFMPWLRVLQNFCNSTYSNPTLLYHCQRGDRLFLCPQAGLLSYGFMGRLIFPVVSTVLPVASEGKCFLAPIRDRVTSFQKPHLTLPVLLVHISMGLSVSQPIPERGVGSPQSVYTNLLRQSGQERISQCQLLHHRTSPSQLTLLQTFPPIFPSSLSLYS